MKEQNYDFTHHSLHHRSDIQLLADDTVPGVMMLTTDTVNVTMVHGCTNVEPMLQTSYCICGGVYVYVI